MNINIKVVYIPANDVPVLMGGLPAGPELDSAEEMKIIATELVELHGEEIKLIAAVDRQALCAITSP